MFNRWAVDSTVGPTNSRNLMCDAVFDPIDCIAISNESTSTLLFAQRLQADFCAWIRLLNKRK